MKRSPTRARHARHARIVNHRRRTTWLPLRPRVFDIDPSQPSNDRALSSSNITVTFLSQLIGFSAPLVALALGVLSLTHAHQSAIGTYGLIQVLPILYFISLAILTASFIITWVGKERHFSQFTIQATVLVILLDGAPAVVETEPRFATAWLTAGFSDYVANTGRVLPLMDARFSWPSFFTGMALLTRAGGLPTAVIVLRWWPIFINILCLPPLFLFAKRVMRDDKKAMLTVWLFPIANWVGQDYYSPQSVAFLLYLVLLCLITGPFADHRTTLLPRLRRKPTASPESAPQPRRQIITLTIILLVLYLAIATGHQLTPFFAIATVTLLAFLGRTKLWAWPVVMFLLTAGWICYGAISYWAGHINILFGNLGSVDSNVSTDLRLGGSPDHYRVDDVRLLLVGFISMLALIGFFMARKTSVDRRTPIIAMLATLAVLPVQQYGGEAGLRAFLFSLPGALSLVSVVLTAAAAKGLRAILTGMLVLLLIPGFLIARWGNELDEQVLPAEITGVRALYAIAPTGSTIVSITPNVTWEFTDVGKYQYSANNIDVFAFGTVQDIAALAMNSRGEYVLITASQIVDAEQDYGLPNNWGRTVERRLNRSHLFRLRYENSAVWVYQHIGKP